MLEIGGSNPSSATAHNANLDRKENTKSSTSRSRLHVFDDADPRYAPCSFRCCQHRFCGAADSEVRVAHRQVRDGQTVGTRRRTLILRTVSGGFADLKRSPARI